MGMNFKETINESKQDAEKQNELLERIKIKFDVSDISSELKDEILMEVNRKIDGQIKRKFIFRRIATVAASVAAVFLIGVFIWFNNQTDVSRQLLATIGSVITEDVEEVRIISGESEQRITENMVIKNTKEGDIVVGEEKKIQADEIKTEYVTVVVPKGRRTTIQFSDGTVAWINSGSKLTYPKEFEKKSRKVYLDGEMYIEVARDEKRPFLVHTEKLTVNVLGTKFNISAYNEENTKSVVLVEGSVEVKKDKQKDKLIPGQGYFDNAGSAQIKPVDTYLYTCWKDGRMKLQDEPFDALLRKLSRYYGVEIQSESQLNSLRFEGNLNLKESIDDILSTLSISKDFAFEKKEGVIEVKRRN